jgi:transposase InsO family protein
MRPAGLLNPLPIPNWKWDDISMDFITGLPTTQKGHDSIWVIVDHLTKSAHFLPVNTSARALEYVDLYVKEIVKLHGVPKTIVSDRGPQFTAHFWKHLQEGLGTKLLHSTAYHPKTLGQTKRVNQVLEDLLRACVLSSKGSWESWLPLAKFVYNNSYQESIKMAPFEVLYGQKCKTPLNWIQPGERRFYGIDFVAEAEDKVKTIQQHMATA